MGLGLDVTGRTLSLAPRGLLTSIEWLPWTVGPRQFDIRWSEDDGRVVASVTNHNDVDWRIRFGLRPHATGATDRLEWREEIVPPGGTAIIDEAAPAPSPDTDELDRGWVRGRLWATEASQFGDEDGVIFKRFGPAVLFGHWQAAERWDAGAMPMSLRFLIHNGSLEHRVDVHLTLVCPNDWKAQGRGAWHWDPPEAMRAGSVDMAIGAVPVGTRTVASFWVRGPGSYPVRYPWLGEAIGLHEDSQPGPGLTIRTTAVGSKERWRFHAILDVSAAGKQLKRTLQVPVLLVPDDLT